VPGYETWIDRQIREAQERGEFDNLPGTGKPIEGLDKRRGDDWWAKSLIEREKLPMPLPPSLALRKEVEDLPAVLAEERTEEGARRIIEDLNDRILRDRRRLSAGPPIFVRTVDVDDALATWRRARAEWDQRRQEQLDELRRAKGKLNKRS
jgi:DnaJ-like protein